MIDNQHTSNKSCFNFRVQKGSSDKQSKFDLKNLLSPSEIVLHIEVVIKKQAEAETSPV